MKSANGMGNIYKLSGKRRKPFVLRGNRYFDEKEQKYKRDVLGYYATYKEAEIDKIAYFTGQIEDPKKKSNAKKGITFSEIYKKWLDGKIGLKKGSLDNFRIQFNRSKKLHHMEIKKINGIFLQDLFNSFDLTNGSLRNLKSFWKNIWDFAILNDFCEKNYAEFLKLPNLEKGSKTSERDRAFTNSELEILWENVYKDTYQVADLILFLCYTGLRADELLHIEPKHVNLKYQYIEVKTSKTKAGIRQVPISERILPIVKNRLDFSNEFLFLRKNKTPFTYDALDDHFRYTCKELDLNYHTLHDCRHTFATMLSNVEANKDAIIKMIGHTNYNTTSKIYIHKNIKELKKVVDKI